MTTIFVVMKSLSNYFKCHFEGKIEPIVRDRSKKDLFAHGRFFWPPPKRPCFHVRNDTQHFQHTSNLGFEVTWQTPLKNGQPAGPVLNLDPLEWLRCYHTTRSAPSQIHFF